MEDVERCEGNLLVPRTADFVISWREAAVLEEQTYTVF